MAGPNPDAAVLRVLPVFDRVEAELRERARTGGWVAADRVITLPRLVGWLAEEALAKAPTGAWWAGRKLATSAELALVRRTIVGARRADPTAEAILAVSGVTGLLAGIFESCAEGLVDPDELLRFATGAANPRVELIARLYGDYRAALAAAQLLDGSDRTRLAHDWLAYDVRPACLAGIERIEIVDHYDWSALRLSLVMRLATRLRALLGPPDRVLLTLPYSHSGAHLFHYLEQTLRDLERQHDVPLEVAFRPLEGEDLGPPARLAAALFADDAAESSFEGSIALDAAPGRELELRAVARRIGELVAGGVAPDRIAIGLRHAESDWREVARALEAYGLPWHYRRGPLLSETPLFAYVADLLVAVQEGLPRDAMERLVTSAFASNELGEGVEDAATVNPAPTGEGAENPPPAGRGID